MTRPPRSNRGLESNVKIASGTFGRKPMPRGIVFFTLCFLSFESLCAPLNVRADDLPSGPIRIIVGFGASSTADTVARVVARYMSDRVGQPVIVENRPGNSSMIAAEYVARA